MSADTAECPLGGAAPLVENHCFEARFIDEEMVLASGFNTFSLFLSVSICLSICCRQVNSFSFIHSNAFIEHLLCARIEKVKSRRS